MKKIKYLLMIVICIFMSCLNVKANEDIKCDYQSDSGETVVIKIDKTTLISNYTNSLGSSQPFFPMNLVDGSLKNNNYMFTNDTGDSHYLYNKRVVEACPKRITNYYQNSVFSSKVEVAYMSSNSFLSGKSSPLKMPIIYFSRDGETNNKESATLITLTNGVSTSDFSSYKSMVFKLKQSESNTPEVSSDGYISCNYKNKDSNGTYNFRFKTNGDLNHQYSYNSGNYQNIKLDGERVYFTSCPSVIKMGNASKTTFTVSSSDACYYDNPLCFYEESVSPYYGNAGTLITAYTEYANSNAQKLSIYFDESNIKVSGDSGKTEISVSNLNDYSTIFKEKETGKYPKYLVKSGNNYTFTSTKPESFDKIYINVTFLTGIQGLGEAEIYKTCEEIFGESFLEWLDENVFMIIRIGVPILLILLTTFDFAKVVFSDDKEGMQNAFKRFTKRAIAAVLIFLTPSLIMLIANLIGGDELKAVTDCVNYVENMHEQSN